MICIPLIVFDEQVCFFQFHRRSLSLPLSLFAKSFKVKSAVKFRDELNSYITFNRLLFHSDITFYFRCLNSFAVEDGQQQLARSPRAGPDVRSGHRRRSRARWGYGRRRLEDSAAAGIQAEDCQQDVIFYVPLLTFQYRSWLTVFELAYFVGSMELGFCCA